MRRRGQSWRAIVIIPLLAVIAVVYAFPIYWLIATSLKSRSQLFQATLSLFPDAPTLQPYADVLIDRGMWILLRNSIVVCGATVLLALTIGLLITYPITRLDVSPRVRAGVLNWALSLRFLPPIAVVVPYFAVVRTVGLYDQPLALIFIYSLFNLQFTIWMLKGFLTDIPCRRPGLGDAIRDHLERHGSGGDHRNALTARAYGARAPARHRRTHVRRGPRKVNSHPAP